MEENIKKDITNLENSKIKNLPSKENKNKSNKSSKENKYLQINENEVKIGNYLIKNTLGKGTFGKVKLGIFIPKNKKVAVKILEKRKLKEEDDIVRLKREFEMLSQFNHPNVIAVSEIFESTEAYFTVMEYCEGGELFNYIVENKYLSEEKSAFFYFQLINGLEYIHSLGIVHRDLKPENLLLTKDHILKIIDFGLSNYFKQNQHDLLETPCGSPCYASPEMLSGENYDGFKIDIWATGIILFAMLCGFLPFDHKDNDKLFMKILECKIQYPKGLSSEAKDLIRKILVPDPMKRITIGEIKKHPFYLKGKEIFESNFTVYQVSQDEFSDSEDSSSFNYYTIENNLFFHEYNHKSEVQFNKFKLFYYNNLKKRNNYSYDKIRLITKNIGKKLVNIEKEIKKMKKRKKIGNNDKYKDKDIKKGNNEKNKLKYNHSVTFLINDINTFCENLINQYKKDEKSRKFKKLNSNKLNNKNQKVKYNDNNKKIQKMKTNKLNNNFNEINNDKNKQLFSNKEKEKILKNINNNKIKKESHFDNSQIISQNKKILNQSNFLNNQMKNNNIKVNIKLTAQNNVNKLFINDNRISRVNKLPINIKLKKFNRKIKGTSTNNSRLKNLKNIIDLIKQQSIKPNINIINKQNIIHHHITNVTNMTQKNYYSNVIINNYKTREDQKNYSTSQNKTKIPLDISENQKEKEKNIINEYLQKNNIPKLNLLKNNTNWKYKNNLQKMILKEDSMFKNINKNNIKNKNLTDTTTNLGSREDETIPSILTIREKKSESLVNQSESKTIQTTNDKKRNNYKTKISNINNLNLNNDIKYLNRKNYNKDNSLNSFGFSLVNSEFMNNSKNGRENKYLNNYITNKTNANINNSVEPRPINAQNTLYRKKKLDKILSSNINLNLNLEQKLNKNKINISSIDNNYRNKSYNNNINNFDINKINNNSNIIYNLNNKANIQNNSTIKKIENMKKNNLYLKNNFGNQKWVKLNLKDIFGIDNLSKRETNSFSNNYNQQIQSQRTRPSNLSNTHKNIDIYQYINSVSNNENKMNSYRNNENKIANTSYNNGNFSNGRILGNQTSNPQFLSNLTKYKENNNNLRNKNYINLHFNRITKNNTNIINMTSDNIKINSYLLKNKNIAYNSKEINNINGSNLNNINQKKFLNKSLINKNRINTNDYLNKYSDYQNLYSSLRKRMNNKTNIMNNTYIDKKDIQNNSIKIKEFENINHKNNSIYTNYNSKYFQNNNTDNNKSGFNYNNYIGLKKNHKKVKSMKEAIINQKSQINQKKFNTFKNFNIENNNNNLKNNINLNDIGLYICNTDGNSNNTNTNNTNNYLNIVNNKFNTIDSNHRVHTNINNLKKNNIIKKMKIKENFKMK